MYLRPGGPRGTAREHPLRNSNKRNGEHLRQRVREIRYPLKGCLLFSQRGDPGVRAEQSTPRTRYETEGRGGYSPLFIIEVILKTDSKRKLNQTVSITYLWSILTYGKRLVFKSFYWLNVDDGCCGLSVNICRVGRCALCVCSMYICLVVFAVDWWLNNVTPWSVILAGTYLQVHWLRVRLS